MLFNTSRVEGVAAAFARLLVSYRTLAPRPAQLARLPYRCLLALSRSLVVNHLPPDHFGQRWRAVGALHSGEGQLSNL